LEKGLQPPGNGALSATLSAAGDDNEDTVMLRNPISRAPPTIKFEFANWFATEATRKAYLDMPLNHPNLRVPFAASADPVGSQTHC